MWRQKDWMVLERGEGRGCHGQQTLAPLIRPEQSHTCMCTLKGVSVGRVGEARAQGGQSTTLLALLPAWPLLLPCDARFKIE